jgi:Spy/CpxP family protein refolding chaperone
MRIWILIFSAALFAGGTCLGVALQPKIAPAPPPAPIAVKPPEMPWEGHRSSQFSVTRFREELKLSDEQDRELDAILTDSQEEMQALGRAMGAAQEKSRNSIVKLLSPEQKSQLESLMAAERKKRSDAELVRNVASWQKILTLNDEQTEKLRSLLAEGRSRRHDYKPGVDWRQMRKDSREQQNKAIEKVLTPDQFKRYLDVSELDRYER